MCHRDGQMRSGVVYSVLKDGLQFLAVVNTSRTVPTSYLNSGDIDSHAFCQYAPCHLGSSCFMSGLLSDRQTQQQRQSYRLQLSLLCA